MLSSGRVILIVILMWAVAGLGCVDEPAPPRGPGWLAQGAPLPPEDDPPPDKKSEPERPTLCDHATLKRALPRLKRNSRLDWAHHSTLVPGHLASRLVEGNESGKGAGRHVMTFIVNDLIEDPQRLALLKEQPKVFKRYPGTIARDNWARVLIKGRYEVLLRAEARDWRQQDRIKEWFGKMRISDLP